MRQWFYVKNDLV
jgi:hypothetical protein